ncbi:hypothetical protein [Microcystis phage Mae-JY35]
MATFQITGPDGKTYRVQGETAEGAFKALQQHVGAASSDAPADPRDSLMGKVDTVMRGAADTLSLGMADEIAAGLGTGFGFLGDYDAELQRQRGIDAADAEDRFGYRLGGQVAGGVGGGVGLARSGLSLGANAANAGQNLGRVAVGGAADGAILGGLHGAGSGEGLAGRAASGTTGLVAGGAVGAAAPYAIAGVGAGAKALAAPIMSRLRPEAYANRALGEGIRRSGMTADDITSALARAQADDQGVFNVADAMGNSGQRMLSTVARTPNEMRQTVVDTLTQRQMGQGERLTRALAEGFNAPDTAASRAASLEAERAALANVNYEAARQGAGAVDVSGAIRAADDIITPGVNRIANPGSGIADDSLEGVIRRARSLITDGRSNLTDFDSVLRAKQDIADMIGSAQRQGKNNQVRLLTQVNSQLDAALERASPQYRSANDAFRAQSRTIDAVEAGRGATSSRTRAADNIRQFQAMEPGEQMAFRAGYADPMIARVEASSVSPTTNRARALMTEKTGQEFPAFAIPQRADRMGRRIAREQRMFETANAAMGGSRTADNLADAAEMSKFDTGVMTNLLRGRPIAAVIDAVTKMANEAKGMPPSVMENIARTLLETNPQAARRLINAGASSAARSDGRRALAQAIVVNMGASGAGRLAAP